MLLGTKIKLIVGTLLAIALFLAGARFGSRTDVVEKVVEKKVEVKGETVTVFKDRIITVTKIVRPDGTTEETTKTEERDKTKKKKETTTDSGRIVVYHVPKYSIGYTLRPKWPNIKDAPLSSETYSHGITAGYNLGYNIWLKAGAIPSDKIYTLGVEYQF